MEVIPVINCADRDCAADKLRRAERFLGREQWVHLDVADGRFTFNRSWADPAEWTKLKSAYKLEVHLMTEEPEWEADKWLAAGAKRLIIHWETIFDPRLRFRPVKGEEVLADITRKAKAAGAEVFIGFNPETAAEKILPAARGADGVMVLAVHPGPAGQSFLRTVLPKIKFLRQALPNAKIETDGGINPETAALVFASGGNMVAAGSYIWTSGDCAEAYKQLTEIQ